MDKIIGNYLSQSNMDFPLDCETLDYIAQNHAMLQALGNIGGDKIILSGCEESDGTRSEGYVFLRTSDYPDGEVLRFIGGSDVLFHVETENLSVTADSYEYANAYTKRYLAPGAGSEYYSWNDFDGFENNRALLAEINNLKEQLNSVVGEPLGIVKLYAGSIVPDHYLPCDGQALKIDEYRDLYAVLGNTYNTAPNYLGVPYTTDNGYFRIPDLRGRFIVGQNSTDSDYKSKGNAGGEKRHTLSAAESGLPAHSHSAHASDDGQHTHNYYDIFAMEKGGWVDVGTNMGLDSTDNDNKGWETERTSLASGSHRHTITVDQTEARSATASHENRPPYYTLAYIIKVQ